MYATTIINAETQRCKERQGQLRCTLSSFLSAPLRLCISAFILVVAHIHLCKNVSKLPFIKITFLLWLFFTTTDLRAYSYTHFSVADYASVHVLVVDPIDHQIQPVRALELEISRETVTTLANRYGAIAAVNGGFWKLNGDPAGVLKINNRWYGTPSKPRGAIGWSQDGLHVLIDRVLTNHHLNGCPEGCEIEVIPFSNPPHTVTENWATLEHIVGGTPVLIKDGQAVDDYSEERIIDSFVTKRHPRTAVGIRQNGEWVFVVVDKGVEDFLGGMTLKELADCMLNLGCVEALNLDGGTSSTMVIEGIVINDPCGQIPEKGKRVTAVSDAILILPNLRRSKDFPSY